MDFKIILSDFDKKRYSGQYKKVFNVMNKGRIFTECYELDESGKRDENGNYILLLSEHPEADQLEQLNNIKGIQILN
jgi:hypothetical protein